MAKDDRVTPSDDKKTGHVPKRDIPTWEQITQNVYDRIEWYATRFIVISTVGVVIGFIALVYGALAVVYFEQNLQVASVFLAAFVGIGALVASAVLLVWGVFWRKKVETRSIF
ncbi:MAG: hypothetical protein C4K49_12715 [Candidatus Thorarchaeota archaeon]|nr:MAG: hypothetical protein C4K49_12715 [Candidatus Thorarchaeota archaeon]